MLVGALYARKKLRSQSGIPSSSYETLPVNNGGRGIPIWQLAILGCRSGGVTDRPRSPSPRWVCIQLPPSPCCLDYWYCYKCQLLTVNTIVSTMIWYGVLLFLLPPVTHAKDLDIIVGFQGGLNFTPSSVNATAGDNVVFQLFVRPLSMKSCYLQHHAAPKETILPPNPNSKHPVCLRVNSTQACTSLFTNRKPEIHSSAVVTACLWGKPKPL